MSFEKYYEECMAGPGEITHETIITAALYSGYFASFDKMTIHNPQLTTADVMVGIFTGFEIILADAVELCAANGVDKKELHQGVLNGLSELMTRFTSLETKQ